MNIALKRSRMFSLVMMICVTMILASTTTMFAYADVASPNLQGITKVSSFSDQDPSMARIQMVIPVSNAFVFIKQGTADNNTFYLWTRYALLPGDRQAILDYVIAQPGVSDDEATIDNVNFIYGYGTFTVTPKHGASYTYAFSPDPAGGGHVMTFDKDRISHYYYGQCDSDEFEPL